MLAKTFKTAAELGIPEHEAHALTTVLYMLEDGEIKPENVIMAQWEAKCGTAHCLAGWAHAVDKDAFPEISRTCTFICSGGQIRNIAASLYERLPRELSSLFGLANLTMITASAEQATAALRHYLETGICNRK
jgi:hypothetical protein